MPDSRGKTNTEGSYDENQRSAQLLTCPKCGVRYFVTNAPANWSCARCPKV